MRYLHVLSSIGARGLFLAFGGNDPISSKRIISAEHCRQINAVMLACGHYDNSGEFAFRVGLPGKSGVGGGILAIAPGRGAVTVWSPGLNEAGTSLVGSIALEHFTKAIGWSVFE
nr:glutaminase [Sphingopyxis sp. BSNA05]